MGSAGPSKESKKLQISQPGAQPRDHSKKKKPSKKRNSIRFATEQVIESDTEEEILRQRRERLKQRRGTKFNKEIIDIDDPSEAQEENENNNNRETKTSNKGTDSSKPHVSFADTRLSEEVVSFNIPDEGDQQKLDSELKILKERKEKLQQRRGTKFERGIACDDLEENTEKEESSNETKKSSKLGVQFNLRLEGDVIESNSDDEFLKQRLEKLQQRRGTKFEHTKVNEKDEPENSLNEKQNGQKLITTSLRVKQPEENSRSRV